MDLLEQVKDAVAQVKGIDAAELSPEAPLELDSIHRITLIAELENRFEVEISGETLDPEVFESLDKLAGFLQGLTA